MVFPGFIGGSYLSQSPNVSADRAVNLYPEPVESGTGKAQAVLYGTPGLRVFTELPSAPVRGLWGAGSELWAVAGPRAYRISGEGEAVDWGEVGDDGRPVQFFPTQGELFIVSAGKGWRWGGVEVAPVYYEEEPEIQLGALAGAFLNGYFVVQDPSGLPGLDPSWIRFRHSGLFDSSRWGTLDFAAKEGHSDALVHLLADHQDLWLWGTETTEVWRNNYSTAPESFPWERDPGAVIHLGNSAPWATVRMPEGVGWLAGDNRGRLSAVWARGYQPQRVSTPAVEHIWSGYSRTDDAEAYTYTEDGHYFWVISFPTADATWVYDATTKLWHERAWWDGSAFHRHRSRGHAYVFDRHFVGDYQNGRIYEMALDIHDDFGGQLRRVRQAQHLAQEDRRLFFSRFQLDAEGGQGLNPVLDWSDDSGRTWTAPRVPQQADAAGDYRHQFQWWRLGSTPRTRTFRTTITAAKRVALIGAYLDVTPGQF